MQRAMLDTRTIQTVLKKYGAYSGSIDGIEGKKTRDAIGAVATSFGTKVAGWSEERRRMAVEQWVLGKLGFSPGKIDGLWGPSTQVALEKYQNTIRDFEPPEEQVAHMVNTWPRESQMRKFYGEPGKNQTQIDLPYPMRLAWDKSEVIYHMTCHRKVAASLTRIFQKTLDHYGLHNVEALRLNMFGGCLEVRTKRGGRSYSVHSWGAAVDLDPEHNGFRWGKNKASLARPEYYPFWAIVEGEGWVSLGREKNYDWMHFQAARF